MKRIIILGATVASFKVIEKIRETDQESSIKLIGYDGEVPIKRDAFFAFISGDIKRGEVDCAPLKYYEENCVNVIVDKKFLRVNFNRGRVFLEGKEKETLEYDQLLIVDVPQNKFPDIKGINKNGIYGFRKISDIEKIVQEVEHAETIVIQSDCFVGLKFAAALARPDKEVVMLLSGKGAISRLLASEIGEPLRADFQAQGLRFITDAVMTEILGDSDLKAVRLASGLVLSTQIVIFSQKDLEFKMFNDSGLNMESRLVVDAQYKTSIDKVYACGDLVAGVGAHFSRHPSDDLLMEQGEIIGAAMCEIENNPMLPLHKQTCDFAGYSLKVLGSICDCDQTQIIEDCQSEEKKYQCVFVRDNISQGALLVNATESDVTLLQQSIEACLPYNDAS